MTLVGLCLVEHWTHGQTTCITPHAQPLQTDMLEQFTGLEQHKHTVTHPKKPEMTMIKAHLKLTGALVWLKINLHFAVLLASQRVWPK